METPVELESVKKTISKQGVANQKYRNKNREKYNKYMRDYTNKRYQNPEIRAKLRKRQSEYYARKKAKKLAEKFAEKSESDDEEIVLKPQ